MIDFRRHRGILIVISLILCAVVLISFQVSGRFRGDLFRSIIVRCIFPFQHALHWTIDSLGDLFQDYILLVDLKKENLRLQEELRHMQYENDGLREYAQTVKRLRNLMQLKDQIPENVIIAEVISYSPSAWFRTIVINKGRHDGVQKGMSVVTWEGVVGRVISTSARSSVVQLIIDRNSSVDVIVQRNRTKGILEGEGGASCRLKYVFRTNDVQIGDRIITSGLGGIFPKGLAIGDVVNVEKKEQGLFQEIEVKPNTDFSRLEEVMVILQLAEEDRG